MSRPIRTRRLHALVAVALLLPVEPLVSQEIAPGAEEAAERLDDSPRHGEWVDIPVSGEGVAETDELRAWVVYPERSDPAPVVVVIHEIYGLTDWIRAVADQLAADGYIAIAPDFLSGKAPDGGGSEAVDDQGAVALVRGLGGSEVNHLVREAARYATSLPAATDRVATLGFCWGGAASFAFAADSEELDAAVVYYGTSPDGDALDRVRAPVLGLYAGDDARVNATIDPARAALTESGVPYAVEIYEGAGHGFLRQQDGREGANLRASEGAWPRTLSFLEEVLGAG